MTNIITERGVIMNVTAELLQDLEEFSVSKSLILS